MHETTEKQNIYFLIEFGVYVMVHFFESVMKIGFSYFHITRIVNVAEKDRLLSDNLTIV